MPGTHFRVLAADSALLCYSCSLAKTLLQRDTDTREMLLFKYSRRKGGEASIEVYCPVYLE